MDTCGEGSYGAEDRGLQAATCTGILCNSGKVLTDMKSCSKCGPRSQQLAHGRSLERPRRATNGWPQMCFGKPFKAAFCLGLRSARVGEC